MEKSLKTKGIVTLIIAIIGIIVMIAKSGLLGLIIYLIAALVSFLSISKENRNSFAAIIAYIKNTIRHISASTLFTNDIYAIIIALIPVMVVVALFMMFYIQPIRAAEHAVDDWINEIDSIFD